MPTESKLQALLQLIRFDKPIGTLLLLWPTLWALWIAAKGTPDWDLLVIFCLGIVMIVYGLEAVSTMGGKYWEMWYLAWENGQIVYKPNYMPKKYAIAIVPISGFLVCVGAIASIIEDSCKFRAGTYAEANDSDSRLSD